MSKMKGVFLSFGSLFVTASFFSTLFLILPLTELKADSLQKAPAVEVGFSASFADIAKWQSTGLGVKPQAKTLGLSVDGSAGAYGRLDSPAITLDVDKYPFLTINLKHNPREKDGWTLALNNETPLTDQQYTNETGVITFDLRTKTGWKGTQKFFLSLYVVGKDKSVNVNWVKIAGQPIKASYELTGEDAARGYLLYPKEPFAVLTYETLPEPDEVGKKLSIFASPGEYEPATFLVYAANELKGVKVEAGALKDKDNHIIPADNIDIRVMKLWYQGGEDQAFSQTVLVPELLLKDDGLIGINTEKKRNIFNFQGIPIDGPDLKPVNIPANSSKQFWLTVKVPDNAVPGTYTSRIKVTPDAAASSEIELEVRVLPIKLLEPEKIYGLYYYSPRIYYYSKDPDGLLEELKDMRAHGMNSAAIFSYNTEFKTTAAGNWEINLDELKKEIDLRIQAGLTGPIIIDFATHIPPFPVKLFRGPYAKDNAPDPEDVKKLTFIIKTMEEFVRKNNYPQLYYYGVDEPMEGEMTERCAIIFDIIQKAGGKTVTAVYRPFLADPEKTGRLLDMAIYASGTADNLFMDPGIARSHKLQLHYWHPLENPNVDRLRFGLLTWKAGLDGAFPYAYRHAYQGDPYQDESMGPANVNSSQRNSFYTYPSQAGPIPTIQWEATRAGIDDVRYLTTLSYWVKESEKSKDNPAVEKERAKGLALLNNLPESFRGKLPFALYRSLTPDDFSSYRRQVADQIIKLQDLLKK